VAWDFLIILFLEDKNKLLEICISQINLNGYIINFYFVIEHICEKRSISGAEGSKSKNK
jgi:hypothetical protein